MGVTRMGVRELRAELAARRAPVSGNKKELVKRLQVGTWAGRPVGGMARGLCWGVRHYLCH